MLISDIMTERVITLPSSTTVDDAIRILRAVHFRRFPVVDDGKLVGIVSGYRLERASIVGSAPHLWQVAHTMARSPVRDIMVKEVVTISPEATVEQGVTLAQKHRVGSLLVVEEDKLVGIVTTNDFFYKVVNQILGIGETGVRIIVREAGDAKSAEKILSCINKLGLELKIIWTLPSFQSSGNDIIVQLDTEDSSGVIQELTALGYDAGLRLR
ncbi:CBS domain-containing protein [Chloroflexota bacterium]